MTGREKTHLDQHDFTVGVDLGGTHIRMGICGRDGALTDEVKYATAELMPKTSPERLGDAIGSYIAKSGKRISAVGMGIPGTLSRDCRSVLNTPNLPELNGLPFAELLSERAGVPVFLENDTVMLLNGDLLRLGLPREGIVLGVYAGTGLGSAVFYNGSPLKGRNGLNEIGHVPIPGRTRRCGCGNTGCAECYVSGGYLQRLRAERFPETHISELFAAMRGTKELDDFVEDFACVLAGAVNLLDPELLVIGGGVPAMRDFPWERLEAALREHAMKPQPSEGLRIIRSGSADSVGILGAADFAGRKLGDN